ncbi:MAG: FAD-dependent 5-carboxymethylaminomethyl-2-thiouridine(34) oxidoreductase MnmC [Pseudomonadota bacterium]
MSKLTGLYWPRYGRAMTRLPPKPDLNWNVDGTPVALGHDDIYFSRDDGLAEAQVVFLAGTGLPERWQGRAHFTMAELGFGTGLNFLALWQLWAGQAKRDGWLHFVSFEGFPLDRSDAEKALGAWPELGKWSDKLLSKWPARAKGVRQVVWPDDQISLTLHIGDIAETLPQAVFQADGWFLDGFSPAKNAAMWDDALWPLIAARSRPGAQLGTFTVAGAVRRGLEAAGFEVDKKPGHGRKRERLEAVLAGVPNGAPRARSQRIAIIGAGIGGAAIGYRLAMAGLQPILFDAASGPAEGTSGNPLALVMPRLDAGDSVDARLMVDGYLSALAFYNGLAGVDGTEIVHHPKDDTEARRFANMLADPPLGLEHLEALAGGVLHKQAALLRPPVLLAQLLSGLDMRWGQMAAFDLARRTVNGEAFDAIILASGHSLGDALPWLKMVGRAGQVESFETPVSAPASAIASGHYALASGRTRLWGASFEPADAGDSAPSQTARQANDEALAGLAPYWLGEARRAEVRSRRGIRATTADRLPMIGALPDFEAAREVYSGLRTGQKVEADMPVLEGVYIAGGFGSRGFTFAPYAAGILTSLLTGCPMPARAEALSAISPARQILRDLKRGRI